MNPNDVIGHEALRMKIYQLLSECFQLPAKGMKAKVRELCRHLAAVDPKLFSDSGRMASAFNQEDGLERLLVDYSQLFVGPYSLAAPPYGSVYLDTERKVMGDSTLDVQTRYARFGIGVSEEFMDMPDHIAAELEFICFLIHKEINSLRSGRYRQACDVLFEQYSFINDHLNAWIPDFSDLVAEHSDTEFYSNLAFTTQRYIAWERAYLSDINMLEMKNPKEDHAAL